MVKIIILGISGRMGHTLCRLIEQRNDCEVVAGIDTYKAPDIQLPIFNTLSECTVNADVLIDFSNPNATKDAVSACIQKQLPSVICTTGLEEETELNLQELSKVAPVFKSANMSLGINLLIELAQKANKILGTNYDIEIIEKHHHNKLDAPSGTAIMIGDAIKSASPTPYEYVYDRHSERKKRNENEIGMHALRGGSIVGDHDVLFCGPDEVITLSHSAASRDVFANGAINAAIFIANKKAGKYSMKELLE